MNNLTEITNTFKIIGIALAALAAVLAILRVWEVIMRRLARHHVTSTDLDLIGRRAIVMATIRPKRPGKIRCQNAAGQECIAEASSDQLIRRGQEVLISAIESGCLRVVLLETSLGAGGYS
ncbi:MAG TPA: hypothetical protein DCM45_00265 [Clostridiales bacterium]|nr:hypothetical protein [Clostridiales bacterium]